MIAQVTAKRICPTSPGVVEGVRRVIGSKWSILGEEKRNFVLPEIDLSHVMLVSPGRRLGRGLTGEEEIVRLMRDGHVRLRVDVGLELLYDQSRIPEAWKGFVEGKPLVICFDGSVLIGPPHESRFVFCLSYSGCLWEYSTRWLSLERPANYVSAVLPWDYSRYAS